MSAVVCGKRTLFDDIHGTSPTAKRLRCGGGSPIRLSPVALSRNGCGVGPGSPHQSLVSDIGDQLGHLRSLFPEVEGQLVERILESSGNRLDSALKSLHDFRLSSNEGGSPPLPVAELSVPPEVDPSIEVESIQCVNGGAVPVEHHQSEAITASEGTEWVELFVREMLSASDIDDARARATRALEALEKTIASRNGVILEGLQKENAALKGQVQALLRDNHILKRAVAIQHEHQLEHEERSRELQQLKQLLSQYQEQVRTLELNSYALSVHLRKAQEGASMPGRFRPDVF